MGVHCIIQTVVPFTPGKAFDQVNGMFEMLRHDSRNPSKRRHRRRLPVGVGLGVALLAAGFAWTAAEVPSEVDRDDRRDERAGIGSPAQASLIPGPSFYEPAGGAAAAHQRSGGGAGAVGLQPGDMAALAAASESLLREERSP
ncbi:MAG: hypothetical protein WD013_04520, partial [Gemmatimonadota bacterium]